MTISKLNYSGLFITFFILVIIVASLNYLIGTDDEIGVDTMNVFLINNKRLVISNETVTQEFIKGYLNNTKITIPMTSVLYFENTEVK